MSLLHAVDEAVKICRAEESRLTENIRQCKEIFSSMRIRVTETSLLENPSVTDIRDDILPQEKQEIEMLEQILNKALKIRSTSEAHKELHPDGVHKKHCNKSKSKALVNHTVKEDDKRKPEKSVPTFEMSKKPNHRRAAGGSVTHGALWTRPVMLRKSPTAHTMFRGRLTVPKSAPVKISSSESQQEICVKTTNIKESSEDNSPSVSCQEASASGKDEKSTTESVKLNEQWIPSPLMPVWRAQRTKQNRLWRKVLDQQSKPVPERSQFTERLRATFPSEWPSRPPVDFQTELDVFSQHCLDLMHCFHTELQAPKSSDSGTKHEKQYESLQILEGLEKMTAELLAHVDHQKKDWERWDKWSSRSLCPVRRRGEWGGHDGFVLPPVLSYTSEEELRELERQMLRVQQLQQALHLQEAMSDSLASYWDCPPGAERPTAVALRGLYSLLAEGGIQFPSLVLDPE